MAGAACPLTSVPMQRPIAQNGSTPKISTMKSLNHAASGNVTPPTVIASTARIVKIVAANSIAIASLDARYAPGGIGCARFRVSQPRSRSSATETPKPNRPGAMTPKTPYVASR